MALDGLEAAIYASVAPTGLRRAPQSLHVAAHAACFFDETSFASLLAFVFSAWRKDRALFAVAMTTVALLAESVHTLSR